MSWSIDNEHGECLCSGISDRTIAQEAQALANKLGQTVTAYRTVSDWVAKDYWPRPSGENDQ